MSGYVNNALTNLPFHNIIGGPLEAAINIGTIVKLIGTFINPSALEPSKFFFA